MSPLPPTRERPVVGRMSGAPLFDGAFPGDVDASPGSTRRRWLRRLGIVLLVLLAVLLGAVAAAVVYGRHKVNELVTPKTAQMRRAQTQLVKPLPNQPANILLLGSDHRKFDAGKQMGSDDQRADTMMLVRLDPKRGSISIMSFPRDLWVSIPGHGEQKINEAYHLGGPTLAVQTIKQLTGLDVNFVMNVDFKGFRGLVDQVGGVWVDVDHKYYNPPNTGYDDIDIKPGYQLLRGRDALDFARFRHTDDDFHRIARQQFVMESLKKQLSESGWVHNVPGLFGVFSHNVEIAVGGSNGISTELLYDYLRLAMKLSGRDVYQIHYAGETGWSGGSEGSGASIVVYDKQKMDDAVAAFLSPSSKAREASADQLVGPKQPSATAPGDAGADGGVGAAKGGAATGTGAPDPSTVTVRVLNGSGVAGSARTMAQQLGQAGYRVDPSQSNADRSTYAATVVFYKAGATAKAAAQALADRIPGASAKPDDASNQFQSQLLVVVGKSGMQLSGAGSGNATGGTTAATSGDASAYDGNAVPTNDTADVTTNVEGGKQAVFDLSTSKMPVMYPSVTPKGSTFVETYPYQFSIRSGGTVFDAYRIVEKTSQGEYWGVQALSWKKPPVLESPTRTVTRGARTYMLFFNGTKLHMVAWHQGTGTYWVSNTVLDALSNKTMMAIAAGVRPLH